MIRHGETWWNREERLQGHRESALTARGIRQARSIGARLGTFLDDVPPWSLCVSPLGRARQSAELILDLIGPKVGEIRIDDRLREIAWGRWEGLRRPEIRAREPALWAWHAADPWRRPPPDGESFGMLDRRVRQWRADTAELVRIIVVGHGTWGRVLRGLYLGLSERDTVNLDAPQDAFFLLHQGKIERIEADSDEGEPGDVA